LSDADGVRIKVVDGKGVREVTDQVERHGGEVMQE
jgi:tRNA U34 5-carboxymethylaminomethyl modifying GTPase MnmE/TrmE